MRILVAGGAGYVGTALIPKLLERGYSVDVVDLLWFGRRLPDAVRVRQEDVFAITENDLEGYDTVIFTAGLSNDPMAEYSPGRNFVSNAAAPAYLAYAAKRAGVKRFIHAGSCSVYGYVTNELCDETSPVRSSYPYGISKLQGEQAVMGLAGPDFSVISFRKGTVCGPSPRMRFDLIVNTMFKCALMDGTITVNNPSIWRPILGIGDAVQAYIRSIEAPDGISGIFNISSGNYTVGEIADLVRLELEKRGVRVRLQIKHVQDFRSYKVSTERAQNVLGFKPRQAVEQIVAELWDRRAEYPHLDDPLYYNIRVFQELDREGRIG